MVKVTGDETSKETAGKTKKFLLEFFKDYAPSHLKEMTPEQKEALGVIGRKTIDLSSTIHADELKYTGMSAEEGSENDTVEVTYDKNGMVSMEWVKGKRTKKRGIKGYQGELVDRTENVIGVLKNAEFETGIPLKKAMGKFAGPYLSGLYETSKTVEQYAPQLDTQGKKEMKTFGNVVEEIMAGRGRTISVSRGAGGSKGITAVKEGELYYLQVAPKEGKLIVGSSVEGEETVNKTYKLKTKE